MTPSKKCRLQDICSGPYERTDTGRQFLPVTGSFCEPEHRTLDWQKAAYCMVDKFDVGLIEKGKASINSSSCLSAPEQVQ